MAPLNVVLICQVVDEDDPGNAAALQWIEGFADRVDSLSVLTLREGRHRLPRKVAVYAIGCRHRPATAFLLYRYASHIYRRGSLSCFFVYQGGPYPLLLMPFKLLGVKIFQWKAHPVISAMTYLNARFCDDRVFTSVIQAFPMEIDHLRVLGQGVDTDQFSPDKALAAKSGDLVTVLRISSVKNVDRILNVLAHCRRRHGKSYRLDVYGPAVDAKYLQQLKNLVQDLELDESVRFLGQVPHQALPGILNRYRLFVNFSRTALDRAVVEAMACGLMVVSSNPCVGAILPPEAKHQVMVSEDDLAAQSDRIHSLLSWDESRQRQLGLQLREIAARDHNLDHLLDSIVLEMRKC